MTRSWVVKLYTQMQWIPFRSSQPRIVRRNRNVLPRHRPLFLLPFRILGGGQALQDTPSQNHSTSAAIPSTGHQQSRLGRQILASIAIHNGFRFSQAHRFLGAGLGPRNPRHSCRQPGQVSLATSSGQQRSGTYNDSTLRTQMDTPTYVDRSAYLHISLTPSRFGGGSGCSRCIKRCPVTLIKWPPAAFHWWDSVLTAVLATYLAAVLAVLAVLAAVLAVLAAGVAVAIRAMTCEYALSKITFCLALSWVHLGHAGRLFCVTLTCRLWFVVGWSL